MSSQGNRRTVADGQWQGRLTQARAFHDSARSLVTLAESLSYNGAISLMVSAAIAYTDCITAKRRGVVNQQDHQTAHRLLREVLAEALPRSQETRLRRLLGRKDEVNYGARSTTHAEAARALADLDEFAAWAESMV